MKKKETSTRYAVTIAGLKRVEKLIIKKVFYDTGYVVVYFVA